MIVNFLVDWLLDSRRSRGETEVGYLLVSRKRKFTLEKTLPIRMVCSIRAFYFWLCSNVEATLVIQCDRRSNCTIKILYSVSVEFHRSWRIRSELQTFELKRFNTETKYKRKLSGKELNFHIGLRSVIHETRRTCFIQNCVCHTRAPRLLLVIFFPPKNPRTEPAKLEAKNSAVDIEPVCLGFNIKISFF